MILEYNLEVIKIIRFIIGVLLGLVLGGIGGLLLAPASGQELRNQIRSKAEATKRRAEAEWQKQRPSVNTMSGTTGEEATGSGGDPEAGEMAG